MLIVDAHLDLSMNALQWNRDITRPIAEIRAAESWRKEERGRATNTVSIPELRNAEIGLCIATVIARANPAGRSSIDFATQQIASAVAQGQLAYYRSLCGSGEMRQLRSWSVVAEHVEAWRSDPSRTPVGFLLSMEGADAVLHADDLASWYDAGLRIVGLAHYGPGVYAHGTGSDGPLTSRGRDILRGIAELGIVMDMTHLADESFWDVMERFHGPMLASHNNCRALVPGCRQFSDDQLRALIERDAVIGGVCDAWMLTPDWTYSETPREAVALEHLVDHIDHICQLAGNARHVAIGSDLDGGFGTEQCPSDLDTIADLQKLEGILTLRGYSQKDIAGVMHGNWLRLFERALP